jgi:hypothetical protein
MSQPSSHPSTPAPERERIAPVTATISHGGAAFVRACSAPLEGAGCPRDADSSPQPATIATDPASAHATALPRGAAVAPRAMPVYPVTARLQCHEKFAGRAPAAALECPPAHGPGVAPPPTPPHALAYRPLSPATFASRPSPGMGRRGTTRPVATGGHRRTGCCHKLAGTPVAAPFTRVRSMLASNFHFGHPRPPGPPRSPIDASRGGEESARKPPAGTGDHDPGPQPRGSRTMGRAFDHGADPVQRRCPGSRHPVPGHMTAGGVPRLP